MISKKEEKNFKKGSSSHFHSYSPSFQDLHGPMVLLHTCFPYILHLYSPGSGLPNLHLLHAPLATPLEAISFLHICHLVKSYALDYLQVTAHHTDLYFNELFQMNSTLPPWKTCPNRTFPVGKEIQFQVCLP